MLSDLYLSETQLRTKSLEAKRKANPGSWFSLRLVLIDGISSKGHFRSRNAHLCRGGARGCGSSATLRLRHCVNEGPIGFFTHGLHLRPILRFYSRRDAAQKRPRVSPELGAWSGPEQGAVRQVPFPAPIHSRQPLPEVFVPLAAFWAGVLTSETPSRVGWRVDSGSAERA